MHLLGERDGCVVVGDRAGGRAVGRSQGNAVVDVQDALGSTWRVDDAGGGDLVVLGVDLAGSPKSTTRNGSSRGGRGGGILGEVVGAQERARDAGVKLGVAVVGAVEHGELEATGVVERQVELAVLGAVGDNSSWADVGLEGIEAEGDDGLVGAERGGYGALRATVAGEARRGDGDLTRIRTGAGTGAAGEVKAREGGSSRGWEEESSEGLHPVRRRFNETTVRGSSQGSCREERLVLDGAFSRVAAWRMRPYLYTRAGTAAAVVFVLMIHISALVSNATLSPASRA